jgi:hypothetical protein
MDNLQGKPHYQAVIDNCPSPSSDDQCEGIVTIYAYLEVTGQLMVKIWDPVKNDYQYKIDNVDDKILPVKAQMKFRIVDVAHSWESANWAARCCQPIQTIPSPNAKSQEDYTDAAQLQAIPIPLLFQDAGFYSPSGKDSFACCEIDVDFNWIRGTIPIAGSATSSTSGSASAFHGLLTPTGTVTISGGGAAAINGVDIPGHFNTKICVGGDKQCYLTLKGDVTDGKAVYDAGAIRTPWPR